jgi:hypothetical protein
MLDLMSRIGASATLPKPGQALSGRIAELAVMALCEPELELILLIECVYADHLLGWIHATTADF